MSETLSIKKHAPDWRKWIVPFAVLCMLDAMALYYFSNLTNLLFLMLLMPLTFVFGGAALFGTELSTRWDYRLLLAFIGCFFLSSALSEIDANAFLENRPFFYVLCMQLLLFYPLGTALSESSMRGTLRTMAYLTILFILALDVLGVYAACTNQYFPKSMGADYGVGVFTATVLDSAYHRLVTLYHPNSVGMFSSLAALLSLYLIVSTPKHSFLNLLHTLTLPVFFVCIAMSNSRTSMLCFSIGAAMFLFRFLWLKLVQRKATARWTACILAAGAACIILLLLYSPANALMERISISQKDRSEASVQAGSSSSAAMLPSSADGDSAVPAQTPKVYTDNATALADAELGEDTLIQERPIDTETLAMSGRTTIWRTALETVMTSPRRILFGISPAQVGPEIGPKLNIWTTEMHCSFIQVLVSCGVVGLLVFLIFLVLLAARCIRAFFRTHADGLFTGYLAIPLFCILLGAVPESFLLVYHFPNLASLWFFLLAGVLMGTGSAKAES